MTPKGIWMFKRRQRVISITGAGGKTSFMYAQALLNVRLGRRVVLTTTTHILRPRPQEGWRLLDAGKNSAEDFLLFGNTAAPPGHLLLCARQCGGQPQKLTSVFSDPREQDSAPSLSDAPFFRKICSRADIIISEADGARGLPLKLPGDFEPVLLQETKTVIGVAGLSCLGKPFGQVCYGDEATLRDSGFSRRDAQRRGRQRLYRCSQPVRYAGGSSFGRQDPRAPRRTRCFECSCLPFGRGYL